MTWFQANYYYNKMIFKSNQNELLLPRQPLEKKYSKMAAFSEHELDKILTQRQFDV